MSRSTAWNVSRMVQGVNILVTGVADAPGWRAITHRCAGCSRPSVVGEPQALQHPLAHAFEGRRMG